MSILITKEIRAMLLKATSAVFRFDGERTTIEISNIVRKQEVVTSIRYDSPEFRRQKGTWVLLYLANCDTNFSFFVDSLKVGDKVTFFARNNYSDLTKELNLDASELLGRVKRYKRDGITLQKRSTLVLDHEFTESSSLGRRIKSFQ